MPVVGVANVIERGDKHVLRFDSDATCCAFDIFSQDSKFLPDRQWARSLDGRDGFSGRLHAGNRGLAQPPTCHRRV